MQRLNYDSPQNLRAFLDARGLGMRKKFGQNFLINPTARQKLVDALEMEENAAVWEVGPGLGAMTSALLERDVRITAFEIDEGFCAALRELFGGNPHFTLIEGDVLKTWRTADTDGNKAAYLLGNLPYTIAATLLADLIEKNHFFKRMTVTVQKEVADRITAKPGSGNYSSFTVLCASAYTVKPLMTLKGASFYPVPHVDSQAVRFDLRTDRDPAAYPPLFRPIVRALFSSRRKTLKNNLTAFAASRGAAEDAGTRACEALRKCGIPENERAENLSLDDFVKLSEAFLNI